MVPAGHGQAGAGALGLRAERRDEPGRSRTAALGEGGSGDRSRRDSLCPPRVPGVSAGVSPPGGLRAGVWESPASPDRLSCASPPAAARGARAALGAPRPRGCSLLSPPCPRGPSRCHPSTAAAHISAGPGGELPSPICARRDEGAFGQWGRCAPALVPCWGRQPVPAAGRSPARWRGTDAADVREEASVGVNCDCFWLVRWLRGNECRI